MKLFQKYILFIPIIIMAINLPFFLYESEILILQPRIYIFFTAVIAVIELQRSGKMIPLTFLIKFYLFTFFLFIIGLLYTNYHIDGAELIKTQAYSIVIIISLTIILKNKFVFEKFPEIIFYCSLFVVGFNIFELINPTQFMKVIGRSSGTYINPNSTTIALLTFSFIGIKYIKNDVNKLLYLIIVGIGVFLSLSRAGILIFIIIFIFHLIQSKSILKNGAIIFGVSIIFPFLIGSVSNSFEQLGSDASRFNLILNLSENTNNISENIEEDGRSVVAKEGYNMTFANPVFGSGTATYRNIPFENQVLETHNIFLAFSVDFGILGFFIYPFFLFFLFLRNGLNFNGIMQFVIFFIWGFASHNVLHEYFLLLVFSYYSIINHNEN